jgi:hypothetical protein
MNNSLQDEAQLLLTLDSSKRQSEVDRRYEVALEQLELTGWVERLFGVLSK